MLHVVRACKLSTSLRAVPSKDQEKCPRTHITSRSPIKYEGEADAVKESAQNPASPDGGNSSSIQDLVREKWLHFHSTKTTSTHPPGSPDSGGWSQFRCFCPNSCKGTTCTFSVTDWKTILVPQYNGVLKLHVPLLLCTRSGNQQPFSVLDVWSQVEKACNGDCCFVQPGIIVLDDHRIAMQHDYR